MADERSSSAVILNDEKRKHEDAMQLTYMRFMRRVLQSVGAWPSSAVSGRGYRLHPFTIYISVQAVVFLFAEVYFIIERLGNLSFLDLGDVIIGIVLTVCIFFRTVFISMKKYGVVITEFIKEFHLIHFKHKGEYENQTYEETNKISHYFAFCMNSLTLTGATAFNIPTVYHNYRHGVFKSERPANVTVEFSIHYVFPGLDQDKHFILVGMFNMFLSYLCAFIIKSMDDFLCLVIFQIIGHIKILSHKLRSFPVPQSIVEPVRPRNSENIIVLETLKNFDNQENAVIKKMIVDCVLHHRFIVRFTGKLSEAFGPMLAFNYLYHLVGLSIQLVECMQGRGGLIRYGPLSLMTLAQLMQLSIIFEVLGTQSEKLLDEVYYVPWESMNVSNQKSVLMFLRRVQTPIRVAGLGMVAVGVQTMAGILKTTFTYCAFLQSLK